MSDVIEILVKVQKSTCYMCTFVYSQILGPQAREVVSGQVLVPNCTSQRAAGEEGLYSLLITLLLGCLFKQ